jgi:hypothetical protein
MNSRTPPPPSNPVTALPIILYESQLTTFKFWFADSIQDGTHYQDELFCRVVTYELSYRSHAYRLGCRLRRHGGRILLTIGDRDCSLWCCLRDPLTSAVLGGNLTLDLPDGKPPQGEEVILGDIALGE